MKDQIEKKGKDPMSNDNRMTLTRRRFLARGAMAAGAVALPYYVPASALGRDGTVAPSERIVHGRHRDGRPRLL